MDFLEIMNELEDELRDKRGLFGKRETNRGLTLLNQLRDSLPDKLDDAEYILGHQQQILKNADTVAKNTIKSAQERAEHMIGATEIMRKADDEAKKMLERTTDRCDLLVKKTKEHLDAMFIEAEQFLLSTLNMIRTNREELRDALLIKKN